MDIANRQKELLNVVQRSFPLVAQPYLALAEKFNISEETVIDDVRTMKELGIMRQISALFDTRAIGYMSALVATKIDDERIVHAAKIINAHPGVIHSCKRNHDYNFWYTIVIPPGQSIDAHVGLLEEMSGLKLTHKFVDLEKYQKDITPNMEIPRFSETELAIIRETQEDLPLVSRPFAAVAVEAQCSEDDVLNALAKFEEKKYLRNFSAVVNRHHVGYGTEVMCVWAVPEKDCGEIGRIMAGFTEVSDCTRRPTYGDWPYSIFTMINGRESSECEKTIATIAAETGISEYTLLWSIEEYKNVPVRYFTPEWDAYLAKYEKELIVQP